MKILNTNYQSSSEQSLVEMVNEISNTATALEMWAYSFLIVFVAVLLYCFLRWIGFYCETTKVERLWTAGGVAVLSLGAGLVIHLLTHIGSYGSEDLKEALDKELSEKYYVQTVEMRFDYEASTAVEDADPVQNSTLKPWVERFTDESLDRAHALVRLDDGRTVPYELRLSANGAELLMLNDDIEAPDPEELQR